MAQLAIRNKILLIEFHWHAAYGNPATMVKNSNTYYYHVNGHGDVVSMTDGSGNIVAEYDYDAYGNILSQSGTMASANPLRYAGYRYDENTGLYYLMARYYDASVGRFITRDSFHGVEDEPLSLNQYNYCEGDPVNNVDPSGLAVANIVGGIIGGVVGALLGYIIADALGLTGWKKWGLIGAVTVAGAIVGTIIGPYVAKASSRVISIINSGLRKASTAAFKASKNIKKFSVSAKHLSNAGGRWAKFNTSSQSQIRSWISKALQSKSANFYPNGSNSYYIIYNIGKTIGTKGQTSIKVVFDALGNIWTAHPVN